MKNVPPQLVEHQTELQQLDPLDATAQAIEYQAPHWAAHIGADDVDLAFLVHKYPGAITRGDLADLARTTQAQREPASARRLFLGVMLWGYGTVGYGPYRTARMLNAPNAARILRSTLDCIRNGAIRRAYEQFNLPMCGSAFFTKYFYFAGLGCDLRVSPLILDSLVMNELKQWLKLDVTRFARFSRNEKGAISVVGRDAARYDHYVETMNRWASDLRCRPDSIELFLFKQARLRANAPAPAPRRGSCG